VISTAAYLGMRDRLAAHTPQPDGPPSEQVREQALHENILAACRVRGWLVFHGSMAHRTRRTCGEPDFTILADRGRTLLVEAKAARGKLSMHQREVQALAAKLGHVVHVVHSMREFYAVIA
jgi:hypothetical protein